MINVKKKIKKKTVNNKVLFRRTFIILFKSTVDKIFSES
jgi:hypothetical protein